MVTTVLLGGSPMDLRGQVMVLGHYFEVVHQNSPPICCWSTTLLWVTVEPGGPATHPIREKQIFWQRGREASQTKRLNHRTSRYLEEFLGLWDFVPQLSGRDVDDTADHKRQLLKQQ